MKSLTNEAQVRTFYRVLSKLWGPQHWWPARTRFEVVAGAYLTQNTAWTNVELALANLRRARRLTPAGVRRTSLAELEKLVRSAGYFRQKAKRLKDFVAFIDDSYRGSLQRMLARPTAELRQELLALKGVGPETADSILLYAGEHPVFVVDAYTRRIVERHELLPDGADYEEIQRLFERALAEVRNPPGSPGFAEGDHRPSPVSAAPRPPLVQTYNEMHALIVRIGKKYCLKAEPKCNECPLGSFLSLRATQASNHLP